MDNPSNADLDMIEELLARMQQTSGAQPYGDVDDDDDDDDYDDDDDDDVDESFYNEQSIQTLLNPYGGGSGGEGGGGGEMESGGQIANEQTMNFLHGLLTGNSSIPGMTADFEAAIGSMGGMSNPMEGAGNFLPSAMQSLIPNMSTDVAGVLAGAFAGGMGSLMEYGNQGGATVEDYGDDDDDEDDDEDDDDELSDEEDEEDDEDDDEEEIKHRQLDSSHLAMGAVGGLMAASMFANGGHHQRFQESSYPHSNQHALMPPPQSIPQHHRPSPMAALAAPLGFVLPSAVAAVSSALASNSHSAPHPAVLAPHHALAQAHLVSLPAPHNTSRLPPRPMIQQQQLPTTLQSPQSQSLSSPHPLPKLMSNPVSYPQSPHQSMKVITTSIAPSLGGMSGGTVCKTDPLAALMVGLGSMAMTAEIAAPMIGNMLGNSGGGIVVNKTSVPPVTSSSKSVIESNGRSLPGSEGLASALALSKMSSAQTHIPQSHPIPVTNIAQTTESQLQAKLEKDKVIKAKEDCEDDKASLGSVTGSETSGMGKSDTESVGKKTPSPLPISSTGQEVGSCASIPDLASATESMRDSDTDNHSEVHNVTANLSDLDSDVHDHKSVPAQQYAVGPLPVVVEHPTYGWGTMVGLDTAKEALKDLFQATSFPAVFEGTEGTCKGILLFGPSGSGKTCLARALAKESNNALFVGINSRYLLTHNPLDAIQLVRCMFEQARRQKPAVILFDEIEALSYHPDNESAISAKNEILAQTRGLTTLHPAYPERPDPLTNNDNILVLGTTNQPWLLEDRIRRVFTYNIHVKLPTEKPRHELFRMFLQNLHHNIDDEHFNCLISKSDGYSAADINNVIRQASHRVPLESQESGPRHLTFDNIASVMTQYRCRFNQDLKQKYTAYITAATHRAEQVEDNSKNKKDKQKGVKKFSHRIAKSLAVAVLSVID